MAPKRPGGAGALPLPVEPPAPPTPDPAELYAALDLGTNSCRMLIAQPKGNQFHVVDSFSKSVQLGAGLEASGRLSRASMARTVQALRICQKKMREARRDAGCAWSRPRPAAAPRNAAEFMRYVRRETASSSRSSSPRKRRGWR